MKKILIASIIGIAAVVSTYGQGSILFESYGYTTDAKVTYGANTDGAVGTGIGSAYNAALLYGFGDISDPGSLTLLPGVTATFNSGIVPAGYFVYAGSAGATITIPGYVSGPVTFQVIAFNGPDFNSSSIRGASSLFTVAGLATGQSPADEFGPALQGFSVVPVPEPTTFALAGLGIASMLIFRRRKA